MKAGERERQQKNEEESKRARKSNRLENKQRNIE